MDFQFFMISSFLLWGPLCGPGLMRLSAQGLGRLTAAGCVRCAQGATGLWPEGCGIAFGHACGPGFKGFIRFKGFRGLWYRPAGDEFYMPPYGGRKTVQPRLRRAGNAPLLVLRTTSPGGGSFLAAQLLDS